MGAQWGWEVPLANPTRYAAIVPISGGICVACITGVPAPSDPMPTYRLVGRTLSAVPVWFFHGDADGADPVANIRQMVQAFREVSAPVKYTEYHGLGHNATWDAAYSPDGKQIATANEAAPVVIWRTPSDIAAGDVYTLSGHTQLVRSASYSHDGRYLLTSSLDGTAKIWDASAAWQGTRAGEALAAITPTFELRRYGLTVSAWHPNDSYIAIGGYVKRAEMYRVVTDTGKLSIRPDPIFTTPEQEDFVFSVGFSPDGRFLATGNAGSNAVARIWDISSISTSHVITTLVGHGNAINTIAYSPNGKCIVTSSDDTTAIIWSAPGGKRLQTLNGHTREVYSAAWNSDGRSIVTASKDGTSRVWDATNAEVREIQRGPRSWVTAAEFSPDDKYIITASADGIARQYFAGLDELLRQANGLVTREFTPGEAEAYHISPPTTRGILRWPVFGGVGAGTSASSECVGKRP
jgi:WD40 repeat protein